MIVFEDFSLQRGGKPLFDVARATIQPGERVGLIGANGAGKSSLFALMQGKLHTDAGEVRVPAQWRIAHVAQETPALARSALDFVLDGDTPLRAAEARIAEAAPLEAVFTTGSKAAGLYRRFCTGMLPGVPHTALPSTSPANARMRLADLVEAYRPLRDALR